MTRSIELRSCVTLDGYPVLPANLHRTLRTMEHRDERAVRQMRKLQEDDAKADSHRTWWRILDAAQTRREANFDGVDA
jgi:hypothetical protein